MKRKIWMVGMMMLAVVTFAADQKLVHFTGKWTLDASRSEVEPGPGAGPGPGPGRGIMAAKNLTVSLDQDMLTIERLVSTPFRGDFTQIDKVSLDGKETPNPSEWGKRTLKASWAPDQGTLTITIQATMNREGQDFTMKTKEVWRLIDEGRVLKIDQTRETPWGERHQVFYYVHPKE